MQVTVNSNKVKVYTKENKIDINLDRIVLPQRSGIAYPPKRWTGQNIISATGDEGMRYFNGSFKRNNPSNPLYYQDLDYNSNDPFFTLKYKNEFGNYNRYTQIDGSDINNMPHRDLIYFRDNLQNCIIVKNNIEQTFTDHFIQSSFFLEIEGYTNFEIANLPEVFDLNSKQYSLPWLINNGDNINPQMYCGTAHNENGIMKRMYAYGGTTIYGSLLNAPNNAELGCYYIQYLD